MQKYITLAIVDDVNSCDCCGKINLKSTVKMRDATNGAIVHFGSVCATKHSGMALSVIKAQAINAYEAQVAKACMDYRASEEAQILADCIQKAHDHKIKPGSEFRMFLGDTVPNAQAKQRAIAAEHGVKSYEIH